MFVAFMHFVIKGVALRFISYFNCVLAPGIHIQQILSGILYWNLCGGSIYDQCRCFWHFLLLPQEVATDCELHWWTTLFCIWGILCFFLVVLVWYFCVQVFLVFPTVAARGRQPLQLHWWTQFWLNSFCQHYYLTTVKEELLRDLNTDTGTSCVFCGCCFGNGGSHPQRSYFLKQICIYLDFICGCIPAWCDQYSYASYESSVMESTENKQIKHFSVLVNSWQLFELFLNKSVSNQHDGQQDCWQEGQSAK